MAAARNTLGFAPLTDEDKKGLAYLKQQGVSALNSMNPFRETGPPPQPSPTPAQGPPVANTSAPAVTDTGTAPTLAATPKVKVGSPLAAPPASPTAQPGFKTTMGNGMTMEGDNQGNRTYTMGTKGQDGYGRMQVHPGTAQPASNPLSAPTGRPADYKIQGSPEDMAAFAAPTGVSANSMAAMKAQFNRMNPEYTPAAKNPMTTMEMPKYLGPESGIGWKTRAKLYDTQMDAYNRATGQRSALDIESMREAGAGNRALLHAQGVNDANAIARERVGGELALNKARIGSETMSQQGQQMEIDAKRSANAARDAYMKDLTPENEAKYRGAIGKFEKEAQYGTIGKYDDQGMKIGESLYNKSTGAPYQGQGGDPTEVGSGAKQATAPPAAIEYLKKNPGQAAAFKQKYGYLPQ